MDEQRSGEDAAEEQQADAMDDLEVPEGQAQDVAGGFKISKIKSEE